VKQTKILRQKLQAKLMQHCKTNAALKDEKASNQGVKKETPE
jgi:hypothetical protein